MCNFKNHNLWQAILKWHCKNNINDFKDFPWIHVNKIYYHTFHSRTTFILPFFYGNPRALYSDSELEIFFSLKKVTFRWNQPWSVIIKNKNVKSFNWTHNTLQGKINGGIHLSNNHTTSLQKIMQSVLNFQPKAPLNSESTSYFLPEWGILELLRHNERCYLDKFSPSKMYL